MDSNELSQLIKLQIANKPPEEEIARGFSLIIIPAKMNTTE